MPIQINDNPDLDKRLEAMASAHPLRLSKRQMAEAVLSEACGAFERTGDPEAWKCAATQHPTAEAAQQNSVTSESVRSNESQDARKRDEDMQPSVNGDSAKPR